ncbi:hypothetical protein CP532_2628 [Ophiocordyceps camponoti-leonardi (nom. inval.)]|nr:hypothetical protein CP532_2628 [Ophiocordyceps camponoti-leonardi (nom. inval.)]
MAATISRRAVATPPPFDLSAPALVELYAHKPLPPLPLNLRPKQRRSPSVQKSWETVAELEASPCRRRRGWGGGEESMTPRSQGRRRSSYKIQQLTGYDVFVTDDCSVASSDRSSEYSQTWDEEEEEEEEREENWFSLFPLLEAVGAETSAGWTPDLSSSPLPLGVKKFAARQGSDGGVDSSPVSRWDPAYGQFSDSKAAGEYHRIATELAAVQQEPRREQMAMMEKSAERSRLARRRPSLGVVGAAAGGLVMSGVGLLPGRRTASQPVERRATTKTTTTTTTMKRKKKQKMAEVSSSSNSSRRSSSAFDGDGYSSDENLSVDGWLVATAHHRKKREEEGGGGSSRTGQVRGLLQRAGDRARLRNHSHVPEERWRRHMRRMAS